MKEKRLDKAKAMLSRAGEMLDMINDKKLTPEEDTALYLNLHTTLLKHLVINTAIIADKLSEEVSND